MLTGGGRLARHQTMRALVDWSYDLLSEEEQVALCPVGYFSGRKFTFEAALAVCGEGKGIATSRVLEISDRWSISRC